VKFECKVSPALALFKIYRAEVAQSNLHLLRACVRACVYVSKCGEMCIFKNANFRLVFECLLADVHILMQDLIVA